MTGVIRSLRDRVPIRPLTVIEGLGIAELQAAQLLQLSGIVKPPVPESVIADLPKIQVERMTPAPMSGATQWSHGRWLIALNGAEPKVRQRFSLAHEFKHVLDNPFITVLYPSIQGQTARERSEQVCDIFAANLLMPRPWVKSLYCDEGVQDLGRLAQRFNVSKMAMQVRLLQMGLVDPAPRCTRGLSPAQHVVRSTPARRTAFEALLEANPGFKSAWLKRQADAVRAAA